MGFVSKVELCFGVTDPQTEQDKSSLQPHDITETPKGFAKKTQLFCKRKLKSATCGNWDFPLSPDHFFGTKCIESLAGWIK